MNDYSIYSIYAAPRSEVSFEAAIEEQVDLEIAKGTTLFWESVGPDAWTSTKEEEIRRAVYHGDAAELGRLIIKHSRDYLFEACSDRLHDEWVAAHYGNDE